MRFFQNALLGLGLVPFQTPRRSINNTGSYLLFSDPHQARVRISPAIHRARRFVSDSGYEHSDDSISMESEPMHDNFGKYETPSMVSWTIVGKMDCCPLPIHAPPHGLLVYIRDRRHATWQANRCSYLLHIFGAKDLALEGE